MASVDIEQVSKLYPPAVRAVNGVTLQIPDRQFTVLVGPSGCGKSTLLRMIAGLEEISSGTISIGGRVVNNVAPKDRDVAMVFQNYALYPHMSVYENMAFGLRLRGVARPEIDRRVRSTADLLAIADLLQRKPRQLSGGQAQRVAVGRAIVRQPQVFLFDEPLSNLDAQHRTAMRRELTRLHRQLQATMILVTHDQVEAMTLGDQIVVLAEGEVQQTGDPRTVYDLPANRFVAGFVGAPAMNFLPATFRRLADRLTCQIGELVWTIPQGLVARQVPVDGSRVTVGIRPEHFSFAESTTSAPLRETLSVIVDDLQHLGSDTLAFFRLAGQECIARLDVRRPLARGDACLLHTDLSRLHLFDEAGKNLRDLKSSPGMA